MMTVNRAWQLGAMGLGGLWLWAGLLKAMDADLLVTVENYRVVRGGRRRWWRMGCLGWRLCWAWRS